MQISVSFLHKEKKLFFSIILHVVVVVIFNQVLEIRAVNYGVVTKAEKVQTQHQISG